MSIDMKITVDELIAAPFLSRSQIDQERIVSDGRPRPSLKMSSVTVGQNASKMSATKYKRREKWMWRCREVTHSEQSLYDKIQWLTASVTTRSFYCWPCLLFQTPGPWNDGPWTIPDVVLLAEGASEHEKTSEHIEAMFHLQTFINQNLKTKDVQTAVNNSDALKRITDVVCSLVAIQQPPNESDNASSLLEIQKCIKTMVLLRKYDSVNKCYSDDAIKLMKESPEIVNRVINAVAIVTKRNIATEIHSSKYVSLILSQHCTGKSKTQISSILRYVVNGKVNEKFIGFSHIFSSAPVDSIYKHIKSIVHVFDISSKCVAISLDGAILPNDELKAFCRKLKSDVPHCIFVPWHSHIIDSVVQQSLSAEPKCKHFLKTLAALEAYFCENSELDTAFDDFMHENDGFMRENRLQDVAKSRCPGNCFITSHFLIYVQENRQRFVMFFDFVIADSSKWDADDITKAVGFRECLQDLITIFFLNVFAKIFTATSALSIALSSDLPERNFGKGIVSDLIRDLNQMQNQDLKTLLANSVDEIREEELTLKICSFVPLFNDMMRRVIAEIEMRYNMLDKFQFCSLFDFEEDEWFEKSTDRLQNLTKFYDMGFNQPQTLSEMELLSQHGAFSRKSVYDFHQYLHESNLKHTFKSLFDISELILTMPFKHASLTHETSVLENIGKWSFGLQHVPGCDDLSIAFVESDYLQEVKQIPIFYDEVFLFFQDDWVDLF